MRTVFFNEQGRRLAELPGKVEVSLNERIAIANAAYVVTATLYTVDGAAVTCLLVNNLATARDIMAPKWTREPPAESGIYWVRWGESFIKAGKVECFRVWQDGASWRYGNGAEVAFGPEGHFDLWCGPISPPEVPK